MRSEELLQHVLETRGYVVIWSDDPRTPGTVLENIFAPINDEAPIKAVVIGATSREDFEIQHQIFSELEPKYGSGPSELPPWCVFHRVIAE